MLDLLDSKRELGGQQFQWINIISLNGPQCLAHTQVQVDVFVSYLCQSHIYTVQAIPFYK